MKLPSGILAAALTGVMTLASANAADLYSGAAAGGYKDGLAYGAANWSGFYLGAHIGGAWATDAVKDTNGDWCPVSGVGCSYNNDATGVFGGGQLGYNYQTGHFVVGPEVDLGYMDLSHTQVAPSYTSADASSTLSGGFYADVTARLGYTFDRTLIYAKGGYAYYGGSLSNFSSDIPGSLGTSGVSGWTAGGGAEYRINPSWSLKAEYQHFDFGSSTNTFPLSEWCSGESCPFKNGLTVDTVKLGLNYFVNAGYTPLK
jgi:outer membrane immunogenic protein